MMWKKREPMRAISAELVVDEKSRTALVWRHENVLIPCPQHRRRRRSLDLAIFGGMIYKTSNAHLCRIITDICHIFPSESILPFLFFWGFVLFRSSKIVTRNNFDFLTNPASPSTPTFQSWWRCCCKDLLASPILFMAGLYRPKKTPRKMWLVSLEPQLLFIFTAISPRLEFSLFFF